MPSVEADAAYDYAQRAGASSGEAGVTDAIGYGLAAVAFALLEVANALRETQA
jgi:hypothetical protein